MLKESLEMVNLNDVEKFYIEGNRHLKPHKISRNMRKAVTEKVVNDYLHSLPPLEEDKPLTSGDFMERDTKKGVAIMTETASQRSDEVRESREATEHDNSDKIHKIKDETLH